MRCYRRLLNILYRDHVTSEDVQRKIQAVIGKCDKLLALVKKRKLGGLAMSYIFWLSKDNYAGHSAWRKQENVYRRRGGKTI